MRRQIADGTLVTTQTAAEIAGVEPDTIWQWARRHRLTPVLRRPRALWRRTDIERCDAETRARQDASRFGSSARRVDHRTTRL